MSKKPIPYGRQDITEEDIQAVTRVLKSDFLTQGPKILEFERAFAEVVNAPFAVAVANATAALHLCAMALEVTSNTRVISTPITFVASTNCIRYCGGQVEFADIDPDTLLLDHRAVRKMLEAAPRGTYSGLIPVDFAGKPLDMEVFKSLAEEFGLWIIEDACHAPGGYFINSKGSKQFCGSGESAELTVFSFHPVKHIACGEGGMITTRSETLYKKLLMLRTHGITREPALLKENHGGWYYEMQALGYNYRLTDIQAALGLSQLARLDKSIARRQEIATRYDKAFAGSQIRTFPSGSNEGHAYHLYVVEVKNRKQVYEKLKDNGIYAQVHYIPVHKMPYYQQSGAPTLALPFAEAYYSKALSLPMYPTLTNEEQNYVIEQVLAAI